MSHVWIKKALTKADRIKSVMDPGRKKNTLPGTHLSDLVSLRKFILLCPFCAPKFHAKRAEYVREPFLCQSKCDTCRQPGMNIQGFVPTESWEVAHCYEKRSTKGRWGLGWLAGTDLFRSFQNAPKVPQRILGGR